MTRRLCLPRLAAAALLLASAASAAPESGPLPAGARYQPPGSPSPVASSRRFVLDGAALDLARGVALPLSAGRGSLIVLVPREGAPVPATAALLDPAGRRLEPGARFSPVGPLRPFSEPDLGRYDLPAQAAVLELETIAAGTFTLSSDADVAAVLVAEPTSDLELRLRTTPLAARSGEPMLLEAILAAGEEVVADATVTARYTDAAGAHRVELRERRPGRYAARIVPQVAAGLTQLEVRIDARGQLPDGTAFARTGLTGAMVSATGAGFDREALVLGPQGLVVELAGTAGRYRLEAVFARGEEALAYSREDLVLAGPRSVALPLPAAAAGADRVAVRLLNLDTLALEQEDEADLAIPGEVLAAALRAPEERALPASKLAARARFHEEP